MWLFIYLLGVIIAYYYIRYFDLKEGMTDWCAFISRVGLSLFSFVAVGLLLFFFMLSMLFKFVNKKLPKDPPKWL